MKGIESVSDHSAAPSEAAIYLLSLVIPVREREAIPVI